MHRHLGDDRVDPTSLATRAAEVTATAMVASMCSEIVMGARPQSNGLT
jgi:hypothetical protein